MSKEWCEYEIDFLIKNYSINGVVYCSNKLNRSVNSIYLKSNKIGLVLEEKWCEEDDIFLIKNYSKLGIKKCSEILNRSIKSIKARTNKLKIKLINNEELINKFKIKHHDFYDYSLVNYIDSKTKIKPATFYWRGKKETDSNGIDIIIFSKDKSEVEKEIKNIENKYPSNAYGTIIKKQPYQKEDTWIAVVSRNISSGN